MSEASPSKGPARDIVRIIACHVFKPALQHLGLDDRSSHIRLTYLPPNLHLKLQELGKCLRREITVAKRRSERTICLYGDCFPGISEYCQRHGASRVSGPYCWEMFLGSERFDRIVEEDAGTYFLEQELICNFAEYCIEPLELYDEEMRAQCFKHYHRLLYVRQPSDPDLVARVSEIARFLGLSLEIEEADYSHLERRLDKLLRPRFAP